ncbi:Hint domain-containing protein [Sulfitobacter pacificus]|uniref:Hint domain-containing protein n=1 Tax=Sulfitobacter pacificus TaxID=1499314 RepID=UPI0031024F09
MPTAYEDQFFTVDPGAPPASGTPLTFQRVEFIDEDDDGNIETGTGDTFNGVTVTQVWEGDTLTVNVPGVGNVTYEGVTFYLSSGSPVFTPTDGQVLQNGTFVSSTFVTTPTQTAVGDFGPTCFTPGTWIDTPAGPRLIEDLQVGDLVSTLDEGAQPIQMIVDDTFRAVSHIAPIRFAAGALGNDVPLLVSPQHRMLITGWRAELYFGQDEVLVAAKHLVNGDTIRQVQGGSVRYIHLLFDTHQIVFGQGIPSESYFPGHARATSDDAVAAETLGLFPQLAPAESDDWQTVRPVLKRGEAALLAA